MRNCNKLKTASNRWSGEVFCEKAVTVRMEGFCVTAGAGTTLYSCYKQFSFHKTVPKDSPATLLGTPKHLLWSSGWCASWPWTHTHTFCMFFHTLKAQYSLLLPTFSLVYCELGHFWALLHLNHFAMLQEPHSNHLVQLTTCSAITAT